jgi:menaquinol-cytochrome c reductase iron-sulfur subunit
MCYAQENRPSIMNPNDNAPRRGFLKGLLALGFGTISVLVPTGAGFLVLWDPIRRRSTDAGGFVHITSIEALPADGEARKFTVVAAATDAWTKSAQVPIGAVYLRRLGPAQVQAFNVVCPHAGCFVDYVPGNRGFHCPCHGSTFTLDGRILDPHSPSPRPLDSLEVEIRQGTEVWVRFRNFLAGQKEKIPVV